MTEYRWNGSATPPPPPKTLIMERYRMPPDELAVIAACQAEWDRLVALSTETDPVRIAALRAAAPQSRDVALEPADEPADEPPADEGELEWDGRLL